MDHSVKLKTTLRHHLAESTESSKYTVTDWMRYRVFGVTDASLYQSIHIDNNKINSLVGMPDRVHRVSLRDLAITNLDGISTELTTSDESRFEISACNKLTSLHGLPTGLETLKLDDNTSLLNLDVDIPIKRLRVTNTQQPDASNVNTSALSTYHLICEDQIDFGKIPKLKAGSNVVIEILGNGLSGSSAYQDIMPSELSVFRLAVDSGVISFAGVNRHLTKIGTGDSHNSGTIQVPNGATDILGFAMIDGIKKIIVTGAPDANKIFQSYLTGGKLSRSQILSLRQELVEAGFVRLTGV